MNLDGHFARLNPGVPARDVPRLMVDAYEGRKPMTSWRGPTDRPRNVWLNKVQEDADAIGPYRCLRCGYEIARGHRAE